MAHPPVVPAAPGSESDTRQQILAEASLLIRQSGLTGISMRKLAARVGITATALYRHFEDKGALVVAVTSEGFELFGRALWRALERRDPLERLRATCFHYRCFAEQYPNFYRVMFMTPCEELGRLNIPEENQRRMNATFQFLVDRVGECLAAGALEGADARSLASSIWAHCHGLVALSLDQQLAELDDAVFGEFYDTSTDRHLRGWGAALA